MLESKNASAILVLEIVVASYSMPYLRLQETFFSLPEMFVRD